MSFKLKTENSLSKKEKYELLIPQIESIIKDEPNLITNLANTTSALKYSFEDFLWVGFYLRDGNKDELVLGPFQGRVACSRMAFGKGVCGTAALRKETILVEDVDKFPGHIVCDALSKSEIVVPILKDNKSVGVLDVDSDKLNNFDNTDKKYFEKIVQMTLYLFKS